MKKAFWIGLMVCLSVFFIFMINLGSFAKEDKKFKVVEEKVVKKDKTIQKELTIPKLKGLNNKQIQQKLNDRFENNIIEFAHKLEKEAEELFKKAEKEDWEIKPRKYDIKTSFQLRYHQNNILSLTVKYYQYTGGAHGNYWIVSHNIDLKTGQELPITAFVYDNSNYKDIINREIKRKIAKELEGGKGLYFKDTFSGISDNPQFYLEDDDIVVYFDLYQIAPYAAGIPEFTISRSLFR